MFKKNMENNLNNSVFDLTDEIGTPVSFHLKCIEGRIEIDLDQLDSGTYILNFSKAGKKESTKVVID
jgi:hypothetical protein